MDEIVITLRQLRGMIGVRVRFEGQAWHVIEVLEDGPSLVLEGLDQARVLQADQFGERFRWVPERISVPVLAADRRALHPDFLSLDLLGSGE
jgi:hypothetical protein